MLVLFRPVQCAHRLEHLFQLLAGHSVTLALRLVFADTATVEHLLDRALLHADQLSRVGLVAIAEARVPLYQLVVEHVFQERLSLNSLLALHRIFESGPMLLDDELNDLSLMLILFAL